MATIRQLLALRLWMPDRPGVLGAVASRIGAVRGDVVGIEIIEREQGVAIDELVVELPADVPCDLLLREVVQVDGVTVEDVRPVDAVKDPRLDSLEAAEEIAGAASVEEVVEALVRRADASLRPDWIAAVGEDPVVLWSRRGPVPAAGWVHSFARGSRASLRVAEGLAGPDHTASASLEHAPVCVALARVARPLHVSERRQLAVLARLADHRLAELRVRPSRRQRTS